MLPEQAIRHYRGEAGREYHDRKRALPEAAFAWVARLRAEKLAQHVREKDVVLEYGVGAGWNLGALKCERKIGYDVSDFLGGKLRERGIEYLAETAVFPEATIDVVVCHHTLEHVPAPMTALNEMRRLLRVGGKLLLFTPFEIEPRYENFNRAEPNHHLYSWNVQTLGNVTEECGFSVVEARTGDFGYDRFAGAWAEKLRIGQGGFRLLRRLALLARPAREVRIVAMK